MISQAFPIGISTYLIIAKRMVKSDSEIMDMAFLLTYILVFASALYFANRKSESMLVVPKKINIEILLKFIVNPNYLDNFYTERNMYRHELNILQ